MLIQCNSGVYFFTSDFPLVSAPPNFAFVISFFGDLTPRHTYCFVIIRLLRTNI